MLDAEQVNRLNDRDGKPMTDKYLVGQLAQGDREWLERVYETTSGHVHMSGQRLGMMTSPDPDDENAILQYISPIYDIWPEASMAEAVDGFAAITDLVLTLARELWRHKESMPPWRGGTGDGVRPASTKRPEKGTGTDAAIPTDGAKPTRQRPDYRDECPITVVMSH
jgi:hypothetical protein